VNFMLGTKKKKKKKKSEVKNPNSNSNSKFCDVFWIVYCGL